MGGRAAIHILPVWQQYGGKMAQPTDRIQTTDKSTGCLGILFRLFWMLGGVAILVFVGIDIVLKSYRVLSIFLYWLTVVAIIVARLVDIRFFRGETYDGKPATMKTLDKTCCPAFGFFLCLFYGASAAQTIQSLQLKSNANQHPTNRCPAALRRSGRGRFHVVADPARKRAPAR
jgi:hypothetical protein